LYLNELGGGNLVVALHNHFTGCRIDDVMTGEFADYLFLGHRNTFYAVLLHFTDCGFSKFTVGLYNDLTGLGIDYVGWRFLIREELRICNLEDTLTFDEDLFGLVIIVQETL